MPEKSSDLLCHVEYPDLKTDKCDPVYPSIQDEESKGEGKTIVVVLFGWSGAKDKHLAKYSDIYLKRGCIIIRCITPPKALFYDFARLPHLARKIVDVIKENKLQSHPIFFNVLSNGGAYIYSHVLMEIASERDPKEFDVRGTIFDSAPFSPTMSTAYRAIKVISSSYSLFGLGYILGWIVVMVGVVRIFWSFNKQAWECSKDGITPWKAVEEIAGAISDRGTPVKLVKFEGSEHILHYRKFPQEYLEEVTQFIHQTMESYKGPTIYWDGYN